jgi:hypothetical protein
MGFDGQQFARSLPKEIKLTPNTWRLLDYLAWRANEEAAKANGGQYHCFPGQDRTLTDLRFSSATFYRSMDELEFTCGFYLITRRNYADDKRAILIDLHIRPSDFFPDAIQQRRQAAEARLSATRGKPGVRKRITSHDERYLPEITSQNESQHLSKREVITSQFEKKQGSHLLMNKDSKQGLEQGPSPGPSRKRDGNAAKNGNPPKKLTRGERKQLALEAVRSMPRKHWPQGLDGPWVSEEESCFVCGKRASCAVRACKLVHDGSEAWICPPCMAGAAKSRARVARAP